MFTSEERQIEASPTPGAKRPSASLLPAFEPASSPILPRPLKRARNELDESLKYPTPIPTSSTAILSSSPVRGTSTRAAVTRTLSTLSERAPLSSLPTVVLKSNAAPVRLGRSSQTCDYQLSANRMISRVHVEASYIPSTSRLDRERVEVSCQGWNGITIHCQSKVYDLKRGETFTSDMRDAEIMIDVHGTRVMLQWPEKPQLGAFSSDEEDFEGFASTSKRPMRRHSTPPSPSPVQTRRPRPVSPVSPSPAVQALLPSSPPIALSREPIPTVEIFEDPELPLPEDTCDESTAKSQATHMLSQHDSKASESQSSKISSLEDFSDHDEENDPIIHSFGPFGANILPRMAAFNTGDSPRPKISTKGQRTEPLRPNISPSQPVSSRSGFDITGHVINQLAYSRLSSTPLSTILSHLPHDAGVVSKSQLKAIMEETACIGEVTREGKDAAGKPLESEFYYIPDEDDDLNRKEAVVNDLRKPGLRACRKQHKQYYWKKPK